MAASKAAMVALVTCMVVVVVVVGQGGNGAVPNTNCRSECYLECMQMRVFTWNECKRECASACQIAPSSAMVVDDGFDEREERIMSVIEEAMSIHLQAE